MEALLIRQAEILDTIKTINSNFKKDSASRKTVEYLEKRVTTLDNLWAEFEQNNDRLIGVKDESQEYFKENIFERTRDLYQDVRKCISTYNKQEKATQPSGEVDELLSKQRTNFRAFSRQIKSIIIDRITDKWELEDELRTIQSRWNTIDSLNLQIDNILRGGDILYEEEFASYERQFKDTKRLLHKKLASTLHMQQSTPQLEIPSFSGNYLQWPTFHDLFKEAIYNNNSLTKTQKMQHLKGKLGGEAERLIRHLNITSENFEIAWDILVHRYNNPLLLFTHQIETLLNQPNVHKQTAYELRKLHDTSLECIHAIDNLGIDTTSWDPLLVHLLSKKLDSETYRDYKESRQTPRELPTLIEFTTFLEGKFTALEPVSIKERNINIPSTSTSNNQAKLSSYKPPTFFHQRHEKPYNKSFHAFRSKCPVCNLSHDLYRCRKFIGMSDHLKLKTLEQYDICKNCLYKHYKGVCNSTKKCKLCKENHNTLLHTSYIKVSAPPLNISPTTTNSQPNCKQHNVNHVAADDEEILLTTVLLKVQAVDGNFHTLRGLLDQGSQISLISENVVQRLGLHRQQYHASVAGIGYGAKQSRGIVYLECQSIYNDYEFSTQALVISKVINNLPNKSLTKQLWPHLQNVSLADPDYNLSKPIDILLDASVYSNIIMSGLIKGPPLAPIAQQTKLGWILSGNVKTFNCHAVINNLSDISKYWEIEDISMPSTLTSGEQYCEDLYKATTTRLQNGMYQVCLPMKPGYEQQLGSSKSKAIAHFRRLEQKMSKNKEFGNDYRQFMHEYQELGDMRLVGIIKEPACYLPHFGVLKPDSTTTKLRVVYNASAKTSTGHSLNDLMHRGPNLQADLQALIITWRQYKYVMTADVEKMFRRIYIAEAHQPLQSIVWRSSPEEPIQNYHLTTVTYGTKAAPYLAMRTLKQIAKDGADRYPLGSAALSTCFYMDDYLGGHNSYQDAKETQLQLINLLKEAKMYLRKWSSNNASLIDELNCEIANIPFQFKCTESRKTLGLKWDPASDIFTFDSLMYEQSDKMHTKRQLLSDISKIFDPIGWLSPLTIKAKLLFQQVWTSGISWDDELPSDIKAEWLDIKTDLQNINTIQVPRYLGNTQNKYILHGYCDSSEKAYSCCIYIVTTNHKGEITSTLVAAKTRLAPLNKKITLPRLELCAALLLSQLMKKVKESLDDKTIIAYGWTDSMVTLGWLQGDTSRWKQFVASRVKKIVNVIPSEYWRHVGTADNPADCATRGINTKQLSKHRLWWFGPKQLLTVKLNEPLIKYPSPDIETKRCSVNAALHQHQATIILELLNNHSSITKIVRIVAWIQRFVTCMRSQQNTNRGKVLSSSEISVAYNIIIKTIQSFEFIEDLEFIKENGLVHKNSKIASLNPFLDEQGVLRVGGRLRNSNIGFSAKYPIILSSHSRFTELIVNQAHLTTLHGGPKLTLAFIRNRYWIVSGNRTIKRIIRQCVLCRRFSSEFNQQIMGDLPSQRVNPSRPFTHTGVDFTGHVEIKANRGRGIKTSKGYIAVFVCLSTKAVHLEIVSDLSTPAFLAAFRRFCARRGTPRRMYSDNGTNFIGANRVLKQEYRQIVASINQDFFNEIANLEIDWNFNAPSFPNAGGIWEAAVKSLKYHLKRVIGEQKLTYEEFSTLLHQIEACLNSRPICALSENPDDEYLSPGHFLVSGPLLSRPQSDPESYGLTRRWQLVQAMNKQFWKSWSSEYLQQLQSRSKWRSPRKNIQVGEVVLIKDENLPAGKWAMGKVQEIHPGKDGYVRVVTLKTKNKIIKRPVNKLVILPVIDQCNLGDRSAHKTQENQKRKHNTRKRNIFFTWIINIFMILSLLITPTLQSNLNFNITALRNNNSLFFDKISNMHLIRDEWKLIVYYDIEPYWQGIELFNKYLKHLDQMCTNTNMTSHCDVALHQLYHGYTELEYYNGMLLPRQTSPRTRRRRGLINGVGYIAHELFGVLDEHFAEKYQKDIELVRANQNNLALLLKNQTSVIEAEYNLLSRLKNSMDKQHKLFNHYLNNLEKENNAIRTQIQQESSRNEFALGAIIANNILNNLKDILDTLLKSITNSYNGHSNIHLLKPEQLRDELNLISIQISRDLSLPIYNVHTDLAKIYRLLKVRVRMTQQYFIFEIKIPLISRETYETYRVLSIPRQLNRQVITMIPVADFIAINLQKDSFIPLAEEEIGKCIQYDTDTQLCPLSGPVYQLHSYEDLCLKSPDNRACQKKLRACEPIFDKLNKLDSYLYFGCDEITITIICEHQVTAARLSKGSGILSIGNDCIIKGEQFTLFSHHQFTNELKQQPEIPKVDIFPINSIINISLPADHILSTNNNIDQEFSDIQRKLKGLKDLSTQGVLTNEVSYHDIHHYALIYIILALTAAAAGVWLWRRRTRAPLGWRPRAAPRNPNVVFCVSDGEVQTSESVSEPSTNKVHLFNLSTEQQ